MTARLVANESCLVSIPGRPRRRTIKKASGMDERLQQSIAITPATESDKPILRNLLQYHAHDMSEFANKDASDADVNDAGLFEYAGFIVLDDYWTDDKRHPFLVRVAGKLAGFAVMLDEEFDDGGGCFFMVDFFILKKYRRQGIGQAVAHALFDQFPGEWQISEMARNLPAQAFWRKIISRYKSGAFGEQVTEDGDLLQSFNSASALATGTTTGNYNLDA
jgi:predicted acetyltransferase